MVAASVLDEGWLHTVRELPGPYLFVTEGVLVYLAEDDVKRLLARLAVQFPGELVALDTYSRRMFDRQQQMAVSGTSHAGCGRVTTRVRWSRWASTSSSPPPSPGRRRP